MGQALILLGAVIIIGVGLSAYTESSREGAQTHICARCLTVTGGRAVLPGSIIITLLLVWVFVLPAIIYSVWRHSARKFVCPSCGSEELVPVESVRGRELAGRVRHAEADRLRERMGLS
jgi:ribosomal protein S27E